MRNNLTPQTRSIFKMLDETKCTLCYEETSLKCDRNLIEGSGAFNPKAELLSLDFQFLVSFSKYIYKFRLGSLAVESKVCTQATFTFHVAHL